MVLSWLVPSRGEGKAIALLCSVDRVDENACCLLNRAHVQRQDLGVLCPACDVREAIGASVNADVMQDDERNGLGNALDITTRVSELVIGGSVGDFMNQRLERG